MNPTLRKLLAAAAAALSLLLVLLAPPASATQPHAGNRIIVNTSAPGSSTQLQLDGNHTGAMTPVSVTVNGTKLSTPEDYEVSPSGGGDPVTILFTTPPPAGSDVTVAASTANSHPKGADATWK